MNAKRIVLLSCVVALALPISVATGQPRGGRHGAAPAPARSTMSHPGMMPGSSRMVSRVNRDQMIRAGNFRTFNDRREDRFESHHPFFNDQRFVRNRFVGNRFVFVDTFGFPFWGWGWGYPYGYYGYDPYGYDYYGGSAYGYGDQSYGYGNGHGNGSSVVELQRQLARAGYYHGAIDGIMGPATRRALREYERTHNQSGYGMTDRY